MINLGVTPWLRTWDCKVVIPAGVSLKEFIRLVHEAGGEVYRKVEK